MQRRSAAGLLFQQTVAQDNLASPVEMEHKASLAPTVTTRVALD
jgi:hypothetical protein